MIDLPLGIHLKKTAIHAETYMCKNPTKTLCVIGKKLRETEVLNKCIIIHLVRIHAVRYF